MTALTKILIHETKEVGLQINASKTKYMYIDRHQINTPPTLTIDGYIFERCSEFKYLGVTLCDKNEEDVEIQVRLNAANKSMYACNKLLSSKDLSRFLELLKSDYINQSSDLFLLTASAVKTGL